jgi:hypothetical protein
MEKAKGSYHRYDEPKSAAMDGQVDVIGIPDIEILAWCPDRSAKEPPEQVHLVFHVERQHLVARFKSPDTLGFIIEELSRYRKLVWKDASDLDCSGEFPKETS